MINLFNGFLESKLFLEFGKVVVKTNVLNVWQPVKIKRRSANDTVKNILFTKEKNQKIDVNDEQAESAVNPHCPAAC
jgi:hypothetical protein